MTLCFLSEISLPTAPSYAAVATDEYWRTLPTDDSQSLLAQLQTSLDIREQLQFFSMAAGNILPLSGVELQTAIGEFNAPGSSEASYQHRSLLMLKEQCLAKIQYSSDQPFTPLLCKQLQTLEVEWLYPLRNALVVTRLQQMAMKDTLTGLGNRRFFDDSLDKFVRLADRLQQSCAVILLDLDNFKQVNDDYGHSAGDDILVAIAESMHSTLRCTDSLFRFGGDEFAVILSGDDVTSTELIAHRLVKAINRDHRCQNYQVTASAGIAVWQPHQNPNELFQQADKALYAAKEAGKNRVRRA
ncbi:GGDEF domain-containing protein [Alkalimonas collagenimarina]|uniref:diguanylate cyclase n=1 Tax=Alkalimonas collagenimarina TaxID=400390 RepID=A0ABT9GVK7_9GAMM|nr:GGDEF domain-containing protein [Alkalimonas collagenimarina]MDP4534939.1 GGDEF domain-containing protein [Alkalimonas collagenimarina]